MSEQTTAAPALAPEPSALSENVNYDLFTEAELRSALSSGDLSSLQQPPAETSPTSAPELEASVTPSVEDMRTPATDTSGPEEGHALDSVPEPVEAKEDTSEEVSPTPEPDDSAPSFAFTPDADEEIYTQERQAFFEVYDVDPNVQFMLDRDQRTIEALRTELQQSVPAEVNELQTQTLNALEQLVTRQKTIKDGREVFVPNTQPILQLLNEHYPHEVPFLAEEFMGMPSQRYRGMTLFQEYLKDYGGLDDEGMETLERFLDNGGRVPVPSYVPRGIDPRYTEAFYRDPERFAIEEALNEAYSTLNNEYVTPADREQARQTILGINRRLDDIQFGIDSRKNQALQEQQQRDAIAQRVQQTARESYVQDANTLLDSFSSELAKKLDMFDEAGAGVTATAYGTMIINALADDEWAGFAQESLRKHGIDINWKQGRAVMDRLWDIEHELAEQAARNASPAETAVTQRRKAEVIKDVKKLQLEALGKIGRVAITGAGRSLEKKVAAAPKQQASRLKVSTQEAPAVTNTSQGIDQYDGMTPEELQSRIGELRHQLAGAGLPMTS